MVKIPGLDDLKKMGSDLLDSAKSIKLSEVMDKVKSGVESVSTKRNPIPQGNEAVKGLFQNIHTSLAELMETQSTQAAAIRKIQGQLSELARVIDANQAAASQTTESSNQPTDQSGDAGNETRR